MKIGLIDVDGHNFPNLALMKLSAYHKEIGDEVEWYDPLLSHPDKIYASKVFTFTRDYDYFPADCDIEKGGTGYDIRKSLPDEIEQMSPDYSIYPQYDFCIGFLTRGCINHCPWCVVPGKEGRTHVVGDIRKIGVRREVRLIDNNFLSADDEFVKEQLTLMSQRAKWKIDFNQALDARFVNNWNAKLLAKVKWKYYVRFSCDTDSMIGPVSRAVALMRENGYNRQVFVYCLAKDVENALKRIRAMEAIGASPFCMPYRDLNDSKCEVPRDLKRLARWCNAQPIRETVKFEDYKW